MRQNTFTKDTTGIQAIQRPSTTEESKARLVTSSYTRKSLDASSWSHAQVSLVGGRIVRRASGDQKMLISPGSIRKQSGIITEDFEQDIATKTGSEYVKVTSDKPKLVRRRTWTKLDEETAHTKGEGYETRKHSGHLTTEDQFMAKSKGNDSVVLSGGKVVLNKQKDNLYIEGELKQKVPEKWEPGQRAAVIRNKDNLGLPNPVKDTRVKEPSALMGERSLLQEHEEHFSNQTEYKKVSTMRQNYQFEIPEVKAWAPGERNAVIKRNDNLNLLSEKKNEESRKQYVVAGERMESGKQIDKVISSTEKTEAAQLNRKKIQNGHFEISRNEWTDNLKTEGEFALRRVENSQCETAIVRKRDHLTLEEDINQKEKKKWKRGEKLNLKTEGIMEGDNLMTEGDFINRSPEKWTPGEKAVILKREDNLKMEGSFEARKQEKWRSGKKIEVIKHNDNLIQEGDFESREATKWLPGERSKVIKRDDNLYLEGTFEKRFQEQWIGTEKAEVVKINDNLHPEGEFHKRPDAVWAPGDRFNTVKHNDNLHLKGEFSKRVDEVYLQGNGFF